MKVKFSLANSFVRYQACSFSYNPSYVAFKNYRDSCYLRLKAVEGEPLKVGGLVGTYNAQGLGSYMASRHRHNRFCRDLCCPRPRAIKGELTKVKESLYGLMMPEA